MTLHEKNLLEKRLHYEEPKLYLYQKYLKFIINQNDFQTIAEN